MKLIKYISVCITTILASFYLFPVYFRFLPEINTKMAMAALGLVLFGYNLAKNKVTSYRDLGLVKLSIWALAVSLASLASMVFNDTDDASFLGYLVSMWVWLGGAYFLINAIKIVHGKADIIIVANYMIAVCTVQCILACIFCYSPYLDRMICGVLGGEETWQSGDTGDRLHGFGASLDVAGLKFAAVLSIIPCIIAHIKENRYKNFHTAMYIGCFIIIVVMGCPISRTTIIGVILAILTWSINSYKHRIKKSANTIMLTAILISIPTFVFLYKTDELMKNNMRFGFEGLFSLAEKGHWESKSNEDLKKMVVWPDNLRTWIIGDGYAANPTYASSYYVGPTYHGFYKGTDIGYLRFIFYFGLIGLLAFMSFFIQATNICIMRFPTWKLLFLSLLTMNFIGWCKVATDLFVVFAPYLCLMPDEKTIRLREE